MLTIISCNKSTVPSILLSRSRLLNRLDFSNPFFITLQVVNYLITYFFTLVEPYLRVLYVRDIKSF